MTSLRNGKLSRVRLHSDSRDVDYTSPEASLSSVTNVTERPPTADARFASLRTGNSSGTDMRMKAGDFLKASMDAHSEIANWTAIHGPNSVIQESIPELGLVHSKVFDIRREKRNQEMTAAGLDSSMKE